MTETVDILGLGVSSDSLDANIGAIFSSFDGERAGYCVFVNPHSYVVSRSDAKFRQALEGAAWRFCDGFGLSLVGPLYRHGIINRVPGYEFFQAVSARLDSLQKGRVFFLGGTNESLPLIVERFKTDFPGILAVSGYAPPFRSTFSEAEIDNMAAKIRDFRPDVLWVGLGTAKQEKLLRDIYLASDIWLGGAVGAVFDFYSGRVPRAPALVSKLGLEWLYRLAKEPRRLWRRTLLSAPVFLFLVFGEAMTRQRRRSNAI